MSISARIARMEAASDPVQQATIVAVDEADYLDQFLKVFLRCKPGPLELTASIAGVDVSRTITLMRHEDALELLWASEVE